MSKRVTLRLIEGSFEQGFPVILRIRDNSTLDETEAPGKLPPAPNVLRVFNNWQSAYDQWQSTSRIRPISGPTNFSCREIAELGSQLAECFNEWLNSDSSEWQKIRDKLQRFLSETDEIQFIIQTEDMRLRQLPWHLWNLFSNYFTNAEFALSAAQYDPSPSANPTNEVRILAILGDTTGINVEQDKAILQEELPDAEIIFLAQPQLQVLNHQLWDQHWDILFFAGHSASQADGSTGQIYINQDDSLSLRDLSNALRTAIRRGLQLAIFNSCDGLGLAQELADLKIRQTIVMRKPVSDFVAQEFLRHFLRIFASGTPLYLAVREARERLQGLENQFPCASWLPVICQNPTKEPLTWSDLLRRPKRQHWLPALKKAFALGLLLVPIISWVVNDKNWYRLHKDGSIWHGWERLDNNPKTIAIDADGNRLYQLHKDGWIWQYTGTPCNNKLNLCPGWERLDNNPKTIAIDADGNRLYQLHNDGSIWQYNGTPCNNDSCGGWVRLGNEVLIGKTDFRWEPAIEAKGSIRLDNNPKTMTQFNFETPKEGWWFAGNAGLDYDKGLEHSGRGNGRVRNTSGWNAINNQVNVEPNSKCSVTAWLETSETLTDGLMSVRFYNSDGSVGDVIREIKLVGAGSPNPQSYNFYTFNFNSGYSNKVLFYVGLWDNGKDSWIQVDDAAVSCAY